MKQFQGLKVRSIKSLRPAEGMGFGSAARIKYITNFTSTNVKFRKLLIFDLYLTVTWTTPSHHLTSPWPTYKYIYLTFFRRILTSPKIYLNFTWTFTWRSPNVHLQLQELTRSWERTLSLTMYISEREDKYLSEICAVMERLMLSSDGVCQV